MMQHLCACILWGNPFHTCGAQLLQNSHIGFTAEIPDKPGVDLVAVSCQVNDVMGFQSEIKQLDIFLGEVVIQQALKVTHGGACIQKVFGRANWQGNILPVFIQQILNL